MQDYARTEDGTLVYTVNPVTGTPASPLAIENVSYIEFADLCRSITGNPKITPAALKLLPVNTLYVIQFPNTRLFWISNYTGLTAGEFSTPRIMPALERVKNLWEVNTFSRQTYGSRHPDTLNFRMQLHEEANPVLSALWESPPPLVKLPDTNIMFVPVDDRQSKAELLLESTFGRRALGSLSGIALLWFVMLITLVFNIPPSFSSGFIPAVVLLLAIVAATAIVGNVLFAIAGSLRFWRTPLPEIQIARYVRDGSY